MSTLALYSNKGGVGKTATAVNLAFLAAQNGIKTLVCDLDPQSSATFYFRVKPKLKRRARGFLRWRKQVDQSIKGTDYPHLDILPADFSHRNLDITFNRLKQRTHRLDIVLKPLKREYDLIILDCPPTINILAENIINVSDCLLVPLIPTTLSTRTFEQLLDFLEGNNMGTGKVAAFFSMVDARKKIHNETIAELHQEYPANPENGSKKGSKGKKSTAFQQPIILDTSVPYLSIIEQMGIYREPVPAYAPNSDAAQVYKSLWAEIHSIL